MEKSCDDAIALTRAIYECRIVNIREMQAAMTYWFINDKDNQKIKQLRQMYI